MVGVTFVDVVDWVFFVDVEDEDTEVFFFSRYLKSDMTPIIFLSFKS